MRTLFGVFASLCVSSLAFSFPGWEMLDSLENKYKVKAEKEECVNFTGVWSGKCTDQDSKVTETKLSIAQTECSNIKINNEEYVIGGANTNSIVAFFVGISNTVSADWNKEKTALQFIYNGYVRSVPPISLASVGSGHMEIKDGILNSNASLLIMGVEKITGATFCTFAKPVKTP